MGHTVHRLEVLLAGSLVLLAGLLVTLLAAFPPPHAAESPAVTPVPVRSTVRPEVLPTASAVQPILASPHPGAIWPGVLLGVGLGGLLLIGIRMIRRCRMLLTGHNRVVGWHSRRLHLPHLRLPTLRWSHLRRVHVTGLQETLHAFVHAGLQRWQRILAPGHRLAITPIPVAEPPITWSAADRMQVVATLLAHHWAASGYHSPIVLVETVASSGCAPVTATIDVLPDEEPRLVALPDQLAATHPGWPAAWNRTSGRLAVLRITPQTGDLGLTGGPLLAPVLQYGRGQRQRCMISLTTWRHLGIYGDDALGVLHTILTHLLYAHPPDVLACTIVDQGQIRGMYQGIPHQVAAPDDLPATCQTLLRLLRRGMPTLSDVRPRQRRERTSVTEPAPLTEAVEDVPVVEERAISASGDEGV